MDADDRRTAGDTVCLHIPDCRCVHYRPKGCTCDRQGKDMDEDEHFLCCPVILTPDVLALLGLEKKKERPLLHQEHMSSTSVKAACDVAVRRMPHADWCRSNRMGPCNCGRGY